MVTMQQASEAGSTSGLVLDLSDASEPTLAGAKAAALAHLLNSGFTVPPGIVIPAPEVARAVSAPDEIRVALSSALSALGDGPFAVRSSGISEDLDDASHAGQFETVLGMRGVDQVLDAIGTVAASADSARIDHYRETTSPGSGHSSAIAILIQPMIQPEAAGAAFSADPVSGSREDVVINAVCGLADRLMDGTESAEEWRIRGDSPLRLCDGPVILDPEEALAIAKLARRVESAFSVPQDIEWAIVDSQLFLLQARPITALPIKPELPEPSGYMTKELEHFAPPASLMTWSIHRPNLWSATQAACQQFGLLVEALDIEYRAGEIYEREIPLGGKDDDGPPLPWWLFGILARVVPDMRHRLRLAREAARTDLEGRCLSRWETEWASEMEATSASLRAVDMETLSNVALASHLDRLRSFTSRAFYIHFQLAFSCILPVHRLIRLAEELFGWDEHQTLRLVHGTSHGSSAGSRDLDRIAALIRNDSTAMAMFATPGLTLDQLENSSPEIASEIHRHLETHGMRLIQNELAHPTYR